MKIFLPIAAITASEIFNQWHGYCCVKAIIDTVESDKECKNLNFKKLSDIKLQSKRYLT